MKGQLYLLLMISKNIVNSHWLLMMILKTLFKALHSTGHALSQGTIEVWTIVKIWKQSLCDHSASLGLVILYFISSWCLPLRPQYCCPIRLTHHPNNRIWMLWCVSVNLAMPEHLVHQHLFHRTFFFTSVIHDYGLTHTFLDIRQHAPNIFLQAYAISICEEFQSIYR